MIKYSVRLHGADGYLPVACYPAIRKFPGGETDAVLQPSSTNAAQLRVTATCDNSDEFMQLVMFLDAATRCYIGADIHLILPYLPYARQDRVCNEGESLSVAVVANILNSFNLASVAVADAHSDVSLALLKNAINITAAELFKHTLEWERIDAIIAPDAGAAKKAYTLAKMIGAECVVANKVRDTKTGNITSITMDYAAVNGKRVAVVDDICDGGRTFIELSPYLTGAEYKILCVTHGIFSKGPELLTNVYDRVFTTDSRSPTRAIAGVTVLREFFK